MSVQTPRYFSLLKQWRLVVLLIAGLFVVAACFHDEDGDGGDPSPTLPSQIIRISVDTDKVAANGVSAFPALSETGRYIVYHSAADNLVADDTNMVRDVFLHDALTGKTTRVSVDSTGVQGDGESISAMVSSDGRNVVFRSTATNLVDNDNNNRREIFLHDTQTGETQRVSVDSAGAEADGASSSPSISAGSEFVVFKSDATNLVVDDNNGVSDVFLRDLQNGTTLRVSLNSTGNEANGQSQVSLSAISGDRRYIVFRSEATNLVSGDSNGINDLFIRDTVNNTTEIVSVHTDGTQSDQGSVPGSISADGRFVVFSTSSTTLVSDDTNGASDVFLRDIVNSTTTRVSVNSTGEEGDASSVSPGISGNGRYVVFASSATNLVIDDTNIMRDIFVKDLQSNEIARVSVSATGIEGDNISVNAVISNDGRYIAFQSDASNLVENDTNGVTDIFIVPNPLAE